MVILAAIERLPELPIGVAVTILGLDVALSSLRRVNGERVIDPPTLGGVAITDGRVWYFILLAAAATTLLLCVNLLRARSGRAWRAIRAHETVAEALGISIAGYKLLAFVISSAITAVAGGRRPRRPAR